MPPVCCLVAEEPGRDDAGLVEDQQVAGYQVLADIAEKAVFDLVPLPGGRPAAAKRRGARRRLGDQFLGQVVVKVPGLHDLWVPSQRFSRRTITFSTMVSRMLRMIIVTMGK